MSDLIFLIYKTNKKQERSDSVLPLLQDFVAAFFENTYQQHDSMDLLRYVYDIIFCASFGNTDIFLKNRTVWNSFAFSLTSLSKSSVNYALIFSKVCVSCLCFHN